MATKWVYMFTEGNATMRNLLGGKGANLAEMTSLGLPVPQGFTVTTEACTQYYEDGRKINDEIMAQIMDAIVKLEEITGKKLENAFTTSNFGPYCFVFISGVQLVWRFFDYIFGVLKCFTVLIHVEICTGSQCTGSPIVDMTSSYYLAGFWEIIQCSLQVIQDGFVSFRNSSSFCCISGFENFCRQYDTRIAGLCITRKFSEQAGQVKVEKCPHTL